ncbi:MAG: DNA-directed RNA polymerase subunit P [Hadesarchaea archaeon]|nr:DNA-directed RNA polymerase subunit P [Hadesarchaea archaeon]
MYRCGNCKRNLKKVESRAKCPYCGYRILYKVRPKIVKTVKAM